MHRPDLHSASSTRAATRRAACVIAPIAAAAVSSASITIPSAPIATSAISAAAITIFSAPFLTSTIAAASYARALTAATSAPRLPHGMDGRDRRVGRCLKVERRRLR